MFITLIIGLLAVAILMWHFWPLPNRHRESRELWEALHEIEDEIAELLDERSKVAGELNSRFGANLDA